MHSGVCIKNLNSVFNTKNKLWINVNGADAESIKQTIDKCPSGALSYTSENNSSKEQSQINAEISVSDKGPLLVKGNIKIIDIDGTETIISKAFALCRCGSSSNKPYCDGTHNKINFTG
ncbi:MAG: CDGSH iron-sulfur domain-containing protein [Ignavibacteria bacterium]|nr:CDGSH iron-sulfur domain-containing protein [Ignavibacteria bacterium]